MSYSPASVVASSSNPEDPQRVAGNDVSDLNGGPQNGAGKQLNIFNNLLARIPDAIICLDRQWRLTFANAEARRVSRLTDADFNTRTHWEVFPESVGTDLELLYRRVMQTGAPGHIEYFHSPFNLWVDVHVLPTEEGIALYYRDISDRKRTEALRDAAVRQLQQVFDATTDSIVCIDRNWNCRFANRAAYAILKTDKLVGENLWIRFPSNQEEPFASNYRTTMEQRIPTEFEAYYPAPLETWFKVSARPYEDGIIIYSSDITSRKKAEARRDATTRQLEKVFETTTDAVVSLSRDWTITFVNRRAKEILAIKGDLIGRNLWEEFPAALSGSYLFHLNRAMDDHIAGEFEEFYPEPLNRWFNIQCIPSDQGIVLFFRDVTAARASKQILLEQQATLAFVQQTARVATWKVDLATGIISFNDGSYPVFGRPCSEITTYKELDKIIRPSDLAQVQASTQTSIETGNSAIIDYQISAPDGSIRWVESRRVPIYDEDGKATHLRALTIDITSRKLNEERLAASEEQYRVLADLNPQSIWMGDPTGRITYANQGFLDYIGLTMSLVQQGLGWLEAFSPEDRQRVLDTWTYSVSTGEDYEIEARMIRASDGAVRWWWLRALPVRDEAGNILNWLGVAMDIHDRKTHAEALYAQQLETERQRAELEAIYQTAPIGLALFDPTEFRYLRLNDRQAAFFGMTPSQVLGRKLTEMAPISGLKEMFQQVASGNPVINQLLEGRLATDPEDVHRFWTVNYFPVYDADGTVQSISAASLEITNQKKAEAALIQSEKLAAVGRLASSISHEINNPLEAITNLLYLVAMDQTLSESLKPYIHMAQSEIARVCQIATQTLRFHRQAVNAALVTAQDLVNAVLNLYQGRLANSGIKVEATYASNTPVLCFENDIRQVLNNLIANAIDAMRKGGRLVVRAHDTSMTTPDHPEGICGVRITIADTGHGMSPEVQARLFEPFYTTKDLNGTGLGLWISSGIVDRHKGRLTLRSTDHPTRHGTVFCLFLPHEAAATIDPSKTPI